MAITIGATNPLRYRGYYYDTETGLYYLQSRYYDPVTCRFINEDSYLSTGQGLLGYNMFAYCNNNPVIYTDVSGLLASDAIDLDEEENDILDPDKGGGGTQPADSKMQSSNNSSATNSAVQVHNRCNNPGGRHGGTAHRDKVQSVKNDLQKKGWTVSSAEQRVYLSSGKYRYPDVIATKNGMTRFYQIGRTTASGRAVSREISALKDLGSVHEVFFVPYD